MSTSKLVVGNKAWTIKPTDCESNFTTPWETTILDRLTHVDGIGESIGIANMVTEETDWVDHEHEQWLFDTEHEAWEAWVIAIQEKAEVEQLAHSEAVSKYREAMVRLGVEPDGGDVNDFIYEMDLGEPDPSLGAVNYARWWFHNWLLPAHVQNKFQKYMALFKLFCTYKGVRYRCIGASRLGDVWLTTQFSARNGYEKRVGPDHCKDWSATP